MEHQYPIYCKHVNSSLVVRFDALDSGEVVIPNRSNHIKEHSDSWINHTNQYTWLQLNPLQLSTLGIQPDP